MCNGNKMKHRTLATSGVGDDSASTRHVRQIGVVRLQSARIEVWAGRCVNKLESCTSTRVMLLSLEATWEGDDFAHRAHLRDAVATFAALLLLQAGPHAARVFVACPTVPEYALASAFFRALSRAPFAQALPAAQPPNAGATDDPYGDHHAACPRSPQWVHQSSG